MTIQIDKLAHFLGGMVLSLFLWPLGLSVTVWSVFGIATLKEVRDWHTGRGTPELADVLATVAGTAAVAIPTYFIGPIWPALLAALLVFFWLYILAMALYRALLKGRLGPIIQVLVAPITAVAAVLDFVMQMTVATLVFLDPPRDLLVTGRLQRYMAGDPGWRQDWAGWICTHLLDPLDPTGSHCDSGDSQTLEV